MQFFQNSYFLVFFAWFFQYFFRRAHSLNSVFWSTYEWGSLRNWSEHLIRKDRECFGEAESRKTAVWMEWKLSAWGWEEACGEWLARIFNACCNAKRVPMECRVAYIVPLHEGKGDLHDCGWTRGKSLLPVVEKCMSSCMKEWYGVETWGMRMVDRRKLGATVA